MHGASCAVASVLLVATAEPWPPQVSVNATLLVAGLIRNGEDDAFLVGCDVFWFGGFCWHRLFFVGKGLSLLEDLTSSIGQSLVETRLEEAFHIDVFATSCTLKCQTRFFPGHVQAVGGVFAQASDKGRRMGTLL